MEFSFSSDSAKRNYLGLILDSSRGKVFNLQECHLVNSWFVEALNAARRWWNESELAAYHPSTDRGSLRTLTLREGKRTGERMAMLTVSGNPDYALRQKDLDGFVRALRQAVEQPPCVLSLFLRIHQARKGMETQFYEILLYGPDQIQEILYVQADQKKPPQSLHFSISPSAFFQPNTEQAEKLYSIALQMLEVSEDSVVYDLYCGAGALGVCLAKQVKQVIGIEISPESSLDAKTNIARNGIDNMTVLTGSVPDVLKKIRRENTFPLPDIVIVDPPRAGLTPDAIRHLIFLNPVKILFVSCHPTTNA
jgi:23S rRNA (uracil1939-C5)-methyltransferase